LFLQEVVVDQPMTTSIQEQLEVQEAVELEEVFRALPALQILVAVAVVQRQPIT
jgi:hypothetical protein